MKTAKQLIQRVLEGDNPSKILDEADFRVWPKDVKKESAKVEGERIVCTFSVDGKKYKVQSANLSKDALNDKRWIDRWVFDMQVALADNLSGKKTKLTSIGKDQFQLAG